jgi:tetratricopeptide (TPR) repeat protein
VFRVHIAILICLSLAGCGRRVPVPASSGTPLTLSAPLPAVPEHVRLFEQGLAAFRQFTPEGYARAAGLFRQASELAAENCEYRLHRAQANLFLAFEQVANLEDATSAFSQSEPPRCGAATAFAMRLEAFRSVGVFKLGRDREESSRYINSAIELEPENELNWFVQWELGLPVDRAANPITRLPEQPTDLALIQYYRGRYWLLRADFDRARKSFESAIALSPRHFRSYMGIAEAISARDPGENVEPYYKRAAEIAPNNLRARNDLADYYAWVAETALAEEQYQAAIKQNSRYVPAYLGLGRNYLNAGSLSEAERALRTAIEIAPTAYEAYYYLGNVSLARENLEKAREQYEAALELVPVYPEALYALGMVFGEKGEFDRALELFEQVLKVSPKHAGAYFWRAVIQSDRKQFADALADCNRSINLYEEQSAILSKSIEDAERHGHMRRASSERKKRAQVEETRQRALDLKLATEKQLTAAADR